VSIQKWSIRGETFKDVKIIRSGKQRLEAKDAMKTCNLPANTPGEAVFSENG
jgi:hypothetical protein